jgi:two-component system, cell cycle sensor histidine kinase and response regulator CckA
MHEVILAVDDEPLVLRIVSEILVKAGYSVSRASSPQEAVELARRTAGPIHLLLSDVVMPGMSGPCLADALENLHPETEVLFMAGLPDTPEVCERIIERGRAFLPKPFTARVLLDKVDHVLGRRAAAAGA